MVITSLIHVAMPPTPAHWHFARSKIAARVREPYLSRLFPVDHTTPLPSATVEFLAQALSVRAFNRLCQLCCVPHPTKQRAVVQRRRARNRVSLRLHRDARRTRPVEYEREVVNAFNAAAGLPRVPIPCV